MVTVAYSYRDFSGTVFVFFRIKETNLIIHLKLNQNEKIYFIWSPGNVCRERPERPELECSK